MDKELNKKIGQATKWSTITEITSKLITPISNAILARLLAPEAFGVVATLTMVITFAEIFTDAGFQKYLVQREFRDEEERDLCTNVAFWTNMVFSLIAWGLITLFVKPIAALVGSEGHELAIIVISAEIPLLALSSIQMARFRRVFDFKNLFFMRVGVSLVPLLITVPAALILRSYWALVIGTLAKDLLSAVVLTLRSPWKPALRFAFGKLKDMLSYCVWIIVENISIWFSSNAGTFIIGGILGAYFLGLYKTTINTVTGYFNVISGAAMPVLFSGLSRCQNDEMEFRMVFFRFQRIMAALVFPLGCGIYVYRELGTLILLGSQWMETAELLGMRSMMQAFMIVFSFLNSEAFRSKGKPKLSVIAQLMNIAVMIPVLYWSSSKGYDSLAFWSCISCGVLIIATSLLAHFALGLSVFAVIRNVWPSLLSALIMAVLGDLFRTMLPGILWELFTVLLCVLVYGGCMYLLPAGRKQLAEVPIVNKLLRLV